MLKPWILLVALIITPAISAAKPTQSITLATTPWCPYTCNNVTQTHGIVGEYLAYLLAQNNTQLIIEHYPWARAVKLAEKGKVDGLLTAVPEEAPSLLFTSVPTMYYQVCFYTRIEDSWQYSSPLTTNNKPLGVINNYGYGEEITRFISDSKNKPSIVEVSGQKGLQRLISMLVNKRVDIIVEDSHVFYWHLVSNNLAETSFKQAGCLPAKPFYIAFNSKHQHSLPIIKFLNQALQRTENKKFLKQLAQPFELSP